jgi:hypothetical protein
MATSKANMPNTQTLPTPAMGESRLKPMSA